MAPKTGETVPPTDRSQRVQRGQCHARKGQVNVGNKGNDPVQYGCQVKENGRSGS